MRHTFAELLTGFRTRARVSQEQLANALRCSRNTISNWERGNYIPRDSDTLEKIREYFNLATGEYEELLRSIGHYTFDQTNIRNIDIVYKQPRNQVLLLGDTQVPLFKWISTDELSDCSVELELRITDDNNRPENWAGIKIRGFHTSEIDIGNGYLIYLRSSGGVEFYRQRQVLSIGDRPLANRPKEDWVSLRVDAIKNTFAIWVNGIKHIELLDRKFGSGYIGLHTYFVKAEFRYIQVFSYTPSIDSAG